jgi:hypothetical protein
MVPSDSENGLTWRACGFTIDGATDQWALDLGNGEDGAVVWEVQDLDRQFYYVLHTSGISEPHPTLEAAQEAALAAWVAERMK